MIYNCENGQGSCKLRKKHTFNHAHLSYYVAYMPENNTKKQKVM